MSRDHVMMKLSINVHTVFRDYVGTYLKGNIKQSASIILLVKKTTDIFFL